jgi:predicted nucleotidyltransferase
MLEKRIKDVLKKDKNILFAYVYGSFGRGEKDFTDVDIAVFVKEVPRRYFEYKNKLALKLEEILNKPVEVRIINKLPLLFVSRIIKEGKVIFSRDNKQRIKFETIMTSKYLDFSYLMREYDKIRVERYGVR